MRTKTVATFILSGSEQDPRDDAQQRKHNWMGQKSGDRQQDILIVDRSRQTGVRCVTLRYDGYKSPRDIHTF